MWNVALGFVAGMLVAPGVKKILRPIFKEVVKAGMVVGTQIQQVASGVKEDLEDITAEASAEIRTKDGEISPPPAGTGNGAQEN
jgi:gas vesicle protein